MLTLQPFPTQNEIDRIKAEHPNTRVWTFGYHQMDGCQASKEEYEDSLRIREILQDAFKCGRCGRCCQISDPVKVTRSEIERIAGFLNIPPKTMRRKHIRKEADHTYSLKNLSPCEFYNPDKEGCKIYPVRPNVCQGYPFLSGDKARHGEIDIEFDVDCRGGVEAYKKCVDELDSLSENKTLIELNKKLESPSLRTELKMLNDLVLAVRKGQLSATKAEQIMRSRPSLLLKEAMNIFDIIQIEAKNMRKVEAST